MTKPLWTDSEWTFDRLHRTYEEVEKIGVGELGLNIYDNRFEVVSAEQMIDAMTSIGMPVFYNHWSFGKRFIQEWKKYQQGGGLPYELVINSSPTINYLIEDNTMTTQAIVMAHAACVSCDTEYLSTTGWRRIDQYDGGKVAQFNPNGTAEFVIPLRYIDNISDEQLIHVKSPSIDQLITNDHTVVFWNGNNLVKINGAELAKRQSEKSRGFNGKFRTGFRLAVDSKLPLTDDEIRLHIAIKADGSYHKKSNDSSHFNYVDHRVRFHLKKQRKIDRLEGLLNSIGIAYTKTPTYGGRYSITFNISKKISKRFDKEWYTASPYQMEIISEEVLHWDGTVHGKTFCSEHLSDVEYIQYVWASTAKHTHILRGTRCWVVTHSPKPFRSLRHGGSGRSSPKPFEYQKSENGHVYCFTVPSGMFITRRNYKISVTGNCGHNHFFKNNYLFKQWTDADAILDYLVFAKNYVAKTEAQFGRTAVESFLDSCHALTDYGVNRYKRPAKLSLVKEQERQREREEYLQSRVDELYRILPKSKKKMGGITETFPAQPEENILYFCEKHAPNLKPWQRELIRIVRKMAQYYLPQGQCVTGNHMVSTADGLLRFDELIQKEGYNKAENIHMLTVGDRFTTASHTYKRKARTIRVTTRSGRVFEGTPEHPLTVLATSAHKLKPIGELRSGDHLVVQVGYDNAFSLSDAKLSPPLFSNAKVRCNLCGMESGSIASHIVQAHDMTTNFYKDQFDVNHVTSDYHRINKSVNPCLTYPLVVSEDFAEFLAHINCAFTSPIDVPQSTFDFRYASEIQAVRIRELLKSLFGISPRIVRRDGKFVLNFCSFTLKAFIAENCPEMLHQYTDTVPKLVRTSRRGSVIAYLRTFFDLNSTCRSNISDFRIIRYDNKPLNELQTVLLALGIVSSIKRQERITFSGMTEILGIPPVNDSVVGEFLFRIHPAYRQRFSETIGTNIENLPAPSSGLSRSAHDDVVPGTSQWVAAIKNKLRDQMSEHSQKYQLVTLAHKKKVEAGILVKQKFPCRLKDLPDVRSRDIKREKIDQYKKLEQLRTVDGVDDLINLLDISKNVYYDQVVSIEETHKETFVYDVTIPEHHLFWLDGVISHNTKISNEGFAVYTHYSIMNRLHEKGLTTDGAHLEFLALHSNVLMQPTWQQSGTYVNPYKLGFEMLRDVERICRDPTEEDRRWFPAIVGENSLDVIKEIVADYRDESFIRQFLSPKIIRDFGFFQVLDNKEEDHLLVEAIQDERGYQTIREKLAEQHEREVYIPKIEVVRVDHENRSLHLKFTPYRGRGLANPERMLKHIRVLWGYSVYLHDEHGKTIGSY